MLWGSADPVFSDVYLHDLERRLPHAVVHRYAKAGHLVPEDADVAGAIVDWLGTLGHRADCHTATAPTRRRRPTGRRRRSTLLDTHGELGDRPAIVRAGPTRPARPCRSPGSPTWSTARRPVWCEPVCAPATGWR